MSCAPACPTCEPEKPTSATRSRHSTPSSPTATATSPSPLTSKDSSPNSTAKPRSPPSKNADAYCDCWPKTSSSAPRRSPSDTASQSANVSPTALTPSATPNRRATINHIAKCVGGVSSPLMCNVYLHRLDRAWDTRAFGVLVRFADDLLVVCKSRQQAQAALARLRQLLAELGVEPKEAKTRIVELVVGGGGFDFLGFHHRMVRSRGVRGRRGMGFLARWPSDRAMRRAREQIRGLTLRSRLLLPVEAVVGDLNRFLRGWAGYFRYGHSTICFGKFQHYPTARLSLFIDKRHKHGRGFGLSVLAYKSVDRCGLFSLSGIVIAPRANKPWRGETECRR